MRLGKLAVFVALSTIFGLAPAPLAQRATPTEAPDIEFAKVVKEWTTKPEFVSPLVDHLPKKAGVPTPKDILGYYIGEPKRLTYTADQQRFFRALEKALPGRVKTIVIGQSEEGRDILVAFVTSEANLKNLEGNRHNLKQLADPRGLSADAIRKVVASTKPHYHLTGGLHSSETNPPETLMELGYRLAVSEEPYIQRIRDNVIVSIAPTTDLDGRDRYVDWYYAYKIDEAYDGGENFGGPPYWGKYVFHDNNRDLNYGVDSLRAHLNWYLHWVPPIWHDLHEQQALLYTFSGQPPQNPNLDPILYTELPLFANYEVNKLTGYGMPGVWHFGFVDMWSPGYLGFMASNHNGMLRMYEIFNQGGANTKKARFQGPPTQRQWFRPNPVAAGEADWSIRNSINYAETGVLSALELASTFPSMLVENFYKKSANSIESGATRPPYAYVIPAGQRDQTQVDRVVNLLRLQGIEIHAARGEVRAGKDTFGPGSYVVKLNQPYGRLAKTLLEKQNYPDAALQTYDSSAWTMGLANNVDVRPVDDKAILDAPARLLQADASTRGATRGLANAPMIAVRHNGSLNLITLRHRLKDVPMRAARAPFKAADVDFPAGSFVIAGNASQLHRVRTEVESLGLMAAGIAEAPPQLFEVDVPKIAMYSMWSDTQEIGWVRLAFDRWEIPFDLIYKDQVRAGASLREKYDVIVMPDQGTSGKSIVYEQPKLSKPLAYRKNTRFKSFGLYGETDDVRGGMGLEGVGELVKFVEGGGLLITMGAATYLPTEFGFIRGVDAQRPAGNWYAPGPYVQSELLRPEHPVLFGYDQKTLAVRWHSAQGAEGALLQVAGSGPPGGGTEGGSAAPIPVPGDRPIVVARFQGGDAGVLSGLMRGADQLRNRPMIVDAPAVKGRVLMFANNPIYRWQTFGEHALVFNALLFYNDFPAAGERRPTSTQQ